MTKLTVSLTILLIAIFSSIALVGTPPVFSSIEDSGSESESEGSNEGGGGDSEPEPEPEPIVEPEVPIEPLPEAALVPEPEPTEIICPVGFELEGETCVEVPEDIPLPQERRAVLPYCDTPEAEGRSCHDLQDYDEETGLYPCNDGTQEENAEDCPDAYEAPLDPNENQTDPSPQQPSPSPNENQTDPGVIVDVGDNGTDPGDNQTDPDPDPDPCEPNGNFTCPDPKPPINNGTDIDIDIFIKNVFKNVNNHGHDNFPEIDIIGLSTKDNGDSNVCLINIDNENVQCQEYGMPSDRVNGDFWRVIETDHDKDYDNGNTGSNDIDGVIDDIKSQDFSELDDATNHDFGIDLTWVAISPSGDGVVCLSEDSTGKGKSLCEPFKVSAQEISGQITEGVELD